ncbi:hypothetical protein [Lacipirellula sp.]|uniref:hypothetical protein n=1 Tax=Lacipirellula sp. TaxID=2691419 RepID=UPI003D113FBF
MVTPAKLGAAIALLGIMLTAIQADERVPPRISDLHGTWSLRAAVVRDVNPPCEASSQDAPSWLEGTLEIDAHAARPHGARIQGKLTLTNGACLEVNGTVREGRHGSPAKIELVAIGSAPSRFGGPPLELEYEFEGRIVPSRTAIGSVEVRGLVQAIRPDAVASEFSVGMFALALAKQAEAARPDVE